MRLIRHGECIRCGDCCRIGEFSIPNLWKDGKCIYLSGNECTVWDTDKRPEVCIRFPLGTEDYILNKLKGVTEMSDTVDFKPLLPNCTFWFEVLRSKDLQR